MQLPLFPEELEVLQHERVLEVQQEAAGRDALGRLAAVHRDRDVRPEAERAELVAPATGPGGVRRGGRKVPAERAEARARAVVR